MVLLVVLHITILVLMNEKKSSLDDGFKWVVQRPPLAEQNIF
jgi:hypothetical protein